MAIPSGISYAAELQRFTNNGVMYKTEKGAIEFGIALGFYLMIEPNESVRETNIRKIRDFFTEFVLGDATSEQISYFNQLREKVGVSFDPLNLSDDEATGVFIRLRSRIEDVTENQPLRTILDHISEDQKREKVCKKLGIEFMNSFHSWIPEIAPLCEGNRMIPEGTVFVGDSEINNFRI